jgi:hypothetical protein
MKRKCLAIGIILLFIGTCIIPSNAQLIDNKLPYSNNINSTKETKNNFQNGSRISDNKFYYDAYGHHSVNSNYIEKMKKNINQEYYNNSYSYYYNDKIFKTSETSNIIYVPDDYPTIQLAINHSSPGDTIIVRDGTYVENLIVNKALIIQSEHGNSHCTIAAKSNIPHVIEITSDYVSIIGFKIQGVSELGRAGICHSNVNHTTIIDNWILLNDFQIYAANSNDNSIHDNILGSSGYYDIWGIVLHYTNNNTIYNNLIHSLDCYAVAIELRSAYNTHVYNNSLSGSYDLGFIDSSNDIIENNTMWVGTFWAHIYMENSSFNIIQNNTFTQGDNFLNDGVEFYSSNLSSLHFFMSCW